MAYLIAGVDLLRELAVMFVTINALNLLPIFPLDGGQFLSGLIPLRFSSIEPMLQLALLALVVAGSFVFDLSTSVLNGFVLGMFLRGAWELEKMKRLSRMWQGKHSTQLQNIESTIPSHMAEDLVGLCLWEYDSSKPKDIAEHAWQIWTSVTAKRPTAKESACLLTVYVLVLLSVVVAQSIYTLSLAP